MVEQAVVKEADAQPKAGTEASDAQDQEPSIDEFLAQFEETESPDETKQEPIVPDDVKEAVKFAKQVKAEREQEAVSKAVDEVVDIMSPVFGELPVELPKGIRRAAVENYARENPRFNTAYVNRHRDPAGFAKIAKSAARDIIKGINVIDADTTADVDAVAASVRASKTQGTPSDDEFNNWAVNASDAELNDWIRKNGGF